MKMQILAALAGFLAVALIVVAYLFFGAVENVPQEEPMPVVIVVRNPPSLDTAWIRFRTRMEELGYRDGENVRYVITEVSTDLASTKRNIGQLLEQRPDLVYTMGVLATRAAKEAAEDLEIDAPIVFAVVSDPVGSGFVESMQHPGGNITGITPASNLTASKRLELLHEMLPSITRVVHPWNDEKTSGAAALREIASSLGLMLVERQIPDVAGFVEFLRTYPFRQGDAILRPSDSIGAGGFNDAVALALEHKVPLVGTNEGDTERGALMSYGTNYGDIGEAAARIAELILRGASPSEIPVEEATRFYLTVNLDTARKIGVTVPESFLLKAHRIIEGE
ncbi:hypothetical protein A2853_03705 [Candidatus Kaiserbacteria bacterium RIFCSPHIGHO2_01_FULL_55_17]|uniref:ABC transporter substrate-binding protein n=1 Tax=Candidatus Kaiserbacteria bacterium RIFCSPHIGHO2_01_FULL_55_17 TaxID=1798484 RepID=A0A1F6D8W0_9BACT|nr:MAG: hypothetical protein A2853_03705 [Candidatus Kaiserbacteria bacterium RIFCSPHIGHO2_01_FULL_55_17]